MPILTWLGSGELIFIAAISLVIFSKREKKMAGVLLLAALTTEYFIVDWLKNTVAIDRPFAALVDARLLVAKAAGFSFPSGHAVTAFMTAAIVSSYFNGRAIWFTLACLAAFSRVYIGVHYPSDVIAGAFIGIAIGYGLVRIAERSKKA